MTRKEKCTMVRLIRKAVAESNDIVYLSAQCDQNDICSRNCESSERRPAGL